MFSYLQPHDGPVVPVLEEFETVYAKNQSEYSPLRTLPGDDGKSAISRWTPTPAQRKEIAEGADILIESSHFGKPLQPLRVMATDARGHSFIQWFALQTLAPYRDQLPGEGDPASAPAKPDPATFQKRVEEWLVECFGPLKIHQRVRRVFRFTEEAIELAQAFGCSKEEVEQLVEYVYGRPKGLHAQEIGGVMTTLAALCAQYGHDMFACAETELSRIWSRIWSRIPEIREKDKSKPVGSPLPGTADYSAAILKAVIGEPDGTLREPPSRCIGYNSGCDGDLYGEAHQAHCPEYVKPLDGAIAPPAVFGGGLSIMGEGDN